MGIDAATAITFAIIAVPDAGHDPLATCEINVPNAPQLVGLPLWVPGLDWFTPLPQTLHADAAQFGSPARDC